jgi:Raf kinase inhibitor-like YbhB/YbcL family protein
MIKLIVLAIASTFYLNTATVEAAPFQASSKDVSAKANIADKFVLNGFGCTGQNISPEITWKNPPAGTKSFAVFVHDPDAPTGGAGFWHWLVVDIPASVDNLSQGAGTTDGKNMPAGARQIATDFGAPGWGGPCPPVGNKAHRYNFTVYALKVEKLELPPNPTASLTGFMVNMNSLGKAQFSARYGR